MCQCQCQHPTPAGRRRNAVQCQLSVNSELVSTSVNSVSRWLPLPSDKSHLDKWLFKENGFLAVCGADLGSELTTTNSLKQKSSWICLSPSFSLPCINPQVLICTVSWNQRKSSFTWVWTSQVFLSLLTWSDKHFAVSSYGTGKEGQKSSGLPVAC